jgi:hypothetical protein
MRAAIEHAHLGSDRTGLSITTNPELSVNAPVVLFDRPYFFAPSGSPRPHYDVTADGKRFLMITSGSAGGAGLRIVVVQHWVEELKRLVPAS